MLTSAKICCHTTLIVALTGQASCSYYAYDSTRFSGDASITDHGPWSPPPRWTITFPPVPLDRDGAYEFVASGLPRHDLFFALRPADDSMKSVLGQTTAAVDITIEDDLGKVLLVGGGPLNPFGAHWKHSEPQVDFHLTKSPGLVDYATGRTYTLRLTITAPSEAEPGLAVHPVLYGGGNEWLH